MYRVFVAKVEYRQQYDQKSKMIIEAKKKKKEMKDRTRIFSLFSSSNEVFSVNARVKSVICSHKPNKQ